MKAIIYKKYGSPDGLTLVTKAQPIPKASEVLIKVRAVSLNASDLEFLEGVPYYTRMWGLLRPKNPILGSDIAGEIVAKGNAVENFQIGDAVLGDIIYQWGGLAEYVCAPAKALVEKPETLPFVEAASLPQAGTVALQAIQKGQIQQGQKVLIIGAGGGAGTFAIQMAKNQGAIVTGVDNEGKLALMQRMGADEVINYVETDYCQQGKQYDLVINFVAKRSLFDYQKLLKPKGQYILVGGGVKQLLQTLIVGGIRSKTTTQTIGVLAHEPLAADLKTLLNLIKKGNLKPEIDKIYPLASATTAFWQLKKGKVKGKVVIKIAD